MSKAHRITFYYRDRCHLCEEMAAYLFRHWPEQADGMRWADIDADPLLREQYNLDVPLLMVNDEIICRHTPDVDRLTQYFGQSVNPEIPPD